MRRTLFSSQYPPPGTHVIVRVLGVVKHYGIVSDRWCDGRPMVISHSLRRGTTAEEAWHEFSGGREVLVARDPRSSLAPGAVVLRARDWIGRAYCPISLNCDHHVRYSLGLAVCSPQLQAGLTTAAVLLGVRLMLGAKPRPA